MDLDRRKVEGPVADHAKAVVAWLDARDGCSDKLALSRSDSSLALDDPCATGGIAVVNGDVLTTVALNGDRRGLLDDALLTRLLDARHLFPDNARLFPQDEALEIRRAAEPHEVLVIFAQDFAPMRISRDGVAMDTLLRQIERSDMPQAVRAVMRERGDRGMTLVAAAALPEPSTLSEEVDVGKETQGKGWASFARGSLNGPSAANDVSFGQGFSDTIAMADDPVVFDWLWWQAATEVTSPRKFWGGDGSSGPFYFIGDKDHLRFRLTSNTTDCLEIARDAAIALLDGTSELGTTDRLLNNKDMPRPGTLRWYRPLFDDPRTALQARSRLCDPAELRGP